MVLDKRMRVKDTGDRKDKWYNIFMDIWFLAAFIAGWCVLLALVARIVLKRSVWKDRRLVLLYMSFMAMFGPIGEIVVGTLYQAAFGQMLWRYELFPVHHGYTSLYAPFIWAVCGLQMWLMAPLMERIKDKVRRYTVMAIDILALELLVNATFLLLAGQLIFYYTPGELGHFASLQMLPIYILASVVAVHALRIMKSNAVFATAACILVCWVVVYLT
jgi:hypothetical protein